GDPRLPRRALGAAADLPVPSEHRQIRRVVGGAEPRRHDPDRDVPERPGRARGQHLAAVDADDRRAVHDDAELAGRLVGSQASAARWRDARQPAVAALSARPAADRPRQAGRGLRRWDRDQDRLAGNPADVVPLPEPGERARARALLARLRAVRGPSRSAAHEQRLPDASDGARRRRYRADLAEAGGSRCRRRVAWPSALSWRRWRCWLSTRPRRARPNATG